MTKINDDNALELRRTLSCEIFNQFVSKTNTFRLEKDKTLAVSTLSPFQTSRISLVSASRISLSSPYLSISDENPSPELSLSRSFTRALSILREKPFLELYLFKHVYRLQEGFVLFQETLPADSTLCVFSPYISISDENPSPELSLSRSFTRALSILREKPFLELYLFKTSGRICIVSGNPS
ncbi:hypothetical protein YC2023_119024 [Brassica napus]